MLTTEVLLSLEALEAISDEWNQLYIDSLTATPFQSPFWMIPWWRNFGNDTLFVIVIKEHNTLIGLAPFYMYSGNNHERVLSLIGTGISDYLDVLYKADYRESIIDQISIFLKDHSDEWGYCDFQELPANSLLLKVQEKLYEFKISWCKQSDCSFIVAEPDGGLKKILPGKLRKRVNYDLKKLKALTPLKFGNADGPEDLIRLHNKRWNDKNEPGVLGSEAIKKFHKDVFGNPYSNGNVLYFLLTIKNIPAACFYVLTHNTEAYFYLGGFDPIYKRYSPGTVALFLTVKHLFKNGYTRFDFLRGNEAYKKYWGVKMKSNYRMQITK